MAGIWNVNNIYNSSQKKVSGKLTFQVGETLAAKVVSLSSDGKSVLVRTIDGWQFPAVLEEPLEQIPDTLLRLQVEGYEDGKVKLKILPNAHHQDIGEQEPFAVIANNNNLSTEDKELLKAMATFSMPLNRQNISKIKSLANFLEKIKDSDEEITQFITKYLASNNIDQISEKGREVTNTLKNFLKELKSLTLEDLLFMEEVGVDLTEENITSFKKVFKEAQGLEKSLETFTKEIKDFKGMRINTPVGNSGELPLAATDSDFKQQNHRSVDISSYPSEAITKQDASNVEDYNYGSVKDIINKENILGNKEFLKDKLLGMITRAFDIKGGKDELLFKNEAVDKMIDQVVNDLKPFINSSDTNQVDEAAEKLMRDTPSLNKLVEPEEINLKLKNIESVIRAELSAEKKIAAATEDYRNTMKTEILDRLSKGGKIAAGSSGFFPKSDAIQEKLENMLQNMKPLMGIGDNQVSESVKAFIEDNPMIEIFIEPERIRTKLENISQVVREKISSSQEVNIAIKDLKDFIISETEGKLSQFYDFENQGWDMLQINSLVEEVSDKIVEQLVQLRTSEDNKSINEVIRTVFKENPEVEMFLEPEEVKTVLQHLMRKDEKLSSHRENNVDNSSSHIIEEINNKLDDIKSMIRSIVETKSELGKEAWNSIINNLKANLNDIKIFNSISGQYYYLDVPIKVLNDEYPCKLIVKDDRESGKRIDSNNVRMAVSISTVNIGVVDAYITVQEKNMKIDFKCDERWVKIIDMAKQKLWKLLDTSVYNISISVQKKEKEMSIANAREFFESSRNLNINAMV